MNVFSKLDVRRDCAAEVESSVHIAAPIRGDGDNSDEAARQLAMEEKFKTIEALRLSTFILLVFDGLVDVDIKNGDGLSAPQVCVDSNNTQFTKLFNARAAALAATAGADGNGSSNWNGNSRSHRGRCVVM